MPSSFLKHGLLFFLVIRTAITIAQNPQLKFDHITTANGLPQEHVFVVLEDKKGFLWLGMESGLVRYDGYTFKMYTHDPEDPA
ncbi:MAG: hypothetical protein KDJ97_27750, partial [Anaerolineae bacterium]|nr:hypothetical protein [Anaerolineae bacterium]